ncbi:MAG: Lrp/AsnC family transcriptional regulator [Candidatus Woesearchaeota archaeon]
MAVSLDLLDRKLLGELDGNSRTPLSVLARRLGTSKGTVLYRINRLKQEGVILGFYPVLDMGRIGYLLFRVFFRLKGINRQSESELIAYLKEKPEMMWVISVDGKYDLGLACITMTVHEMDDIWGAFMKRFGNYVEDVRFAIQTKVEQYDRVYLYDGAKNENSAAFYSCSGTETVSELDSAILRTLSRDARIPTTEVARNVGADVKTVMARIKKLEQKNIITGYKTNFDLGVLGYAYFKIELKLHNTNPTALLALRQYVKEHPNIIYNDYALGGEDVELEVQVKSVEDLRDLVNDIRDKFSAIIQDTSTMHFYKEHKLSFTLWESHTN